MKIAGFTATTSNRMPEALLLAASYRRHHPEAEFTVICLDSTWALSIWRNAAPHGVQFLTEHDLGTFPIPYRTRFEWDNQAFIRMAALAAATRLIEAHPNTSFFYAAPWTCVHSSLRSFSSSAPEHPWSLVPRMLRPFAGEAASRPLYGPDRFEIDLIGTGYFSTDAFFIHGDVAREALNWTISRLRRLTTHAASANVGLDGGHVFVNALDLATRFFDPHVIRHDGMELAPWNLGERQLVKDPQGRVSTPSGPLLLTNHSGYVPETPWTARHAQADSAPNDLNDFPLARDVWSEYGENLLAMRDKVLAPLHGEGELVLPGLPMTPELRAIVRRNSLRLDHGLTQPGPLDAHHHSGAERLAWFHQEAVEQRFSLTGAAGMMATRIKPTLENISLTSTIGGGDTTGISEPRASRISGPGVDVIGHLKSSTGLGEAGRRMFAMLSGDDLRTSAVNIPLPTNPDSVEFDVSERLQHDILLAVMNGDVMSSVRDHVGSSAYDRRYVIGQWAWETAELPAEHRAGFAYVDEIWANSTYVRDVVQRSAPDHIPVVHIPIPIEQPVIDPDLDRAALGLDDRPLFLFVFDYLSRAERKNPIGVVNAFREAFSESDGVQLVLKSVNGRHASNQFEQVRWAASGRRDITLLDIQLTRTETNSLISHADVYVSLHRSEGLGFTMAEAMLLGRPVIATAYSGNLDFCCDDCTMLVPAALTTLAVDDPPYLRGSMWAEPDIAYAADAMRKLAADEYLRTTLGQVGREHAQQYFATARCRQIALQRLTEIRNVQKRR